MFGNDTNSPATDASIMSIQVLQQHCDFFDTDKDGIIWPSDTFFGFHRLGFGTLLSILSVFIIHSALSYPTLYTFVPDPMFRIYTANIHKDKHGSDAGTYDNEGRFVPQKFEEIFSKYAQGKDGITFWETMNLLKGQRLIMDPVGWSGAFFECIKLRQHHITCSTFSTLTFLSGLATYVMLWPEDGRMRKEDIRRVYDGSIFYTIAERRATNE
jgi:peroxygenase